MKLNGTTLHRLRRVERALADELPAPRADVGTEWEAWRHRLAPWVADGQLRDFALGWAALKPSDSLEAGLQAAGETIKDATAWVPDDARRRFLAKVLTCGAKGWDLDGFSAGELDALFAFIDGRVSVIAEPPKRKRRRFYTPPKLAPPAPPRAVTPQLEREPEPSLIVAHEAPSQPEGGTWGISEEALWRSQSRPRSRPSELAEFYAKEFPEPS
jgi:hypothetical protein